MRALVIALVLGAGCGSKSAGTTAPAAVAAAFPAARYVPAQPTYVVSARTMREAQVAFTQVMDMLGMIGGWEVSEASHGLQGMLGIDPMNASAVAGIGIDLEGSIALFSEGLNPTFVVHLKSADAMTGFLEGQRQKGLRTQSVIAAGTEIFTAKLASNAHISWAVEKEWLWVHFSFGGVEGPEWFEHSKDPGGAGWVDGWKWAQQLAAKSAPVIGVMDLSTVFSKFATKVPEALACAQQFSAVKRVGLNFDIDAKQFAVELAFDLGAGGDRVRSLLLPPPPGWTTAAANAPIAAQVNLDLPAATAWLEVCSGDDDFRVSVEETGLRSIRGFLHKLDPGENEGTGAVSADLTSARYLRGMLDQIPGRSMAESSRTFGQYKGKHLSVPFVGKGDYVLTESLAIGAMGDGVLATIGTGGAPAGLPAVVLVEVRPPGMPADVWQFLLELVDAPEPKRLVQRLMLWTELGLAAHLDGSALVIAAHGNRR